jgi:hypothetical protein
LDRLAVLAAIAAAALVATTTAATAAPAGAAARPGAAKWTCQGSYGGIVGDGNRRGRQVTSECYSNGMNSHSARFFPYGEHLIISDAVDNDRASVVYLTASGQGTPWFYGREGANVDLNLDCLEDLRVRVQLCTSDSPKVYCGPEDSVAAPDASLHHTSPPDPVAGGAFASPPPTGVASSTSRGTSAEITDHPPASTGSWPPPGPGIPGDLGHSQSV